MVTPNCTQNIALILRVMEIILQEVSLLHDFLTQYLNLTQMEVFPSFFPPFPKKNHLGVCVDPALSGN